MITDPKDPRLADYADLRDATLRHAADSLFVAEGETVVRQLLASRYRTRSVLVTPVRLEAIQNALKPGVEVLVATPEVIEAAAGFAFHRGVMAVGERGTPQDPFALAGQATALVIAEDLTNVDNLGSLFRCVSALAPAGTGVLLSPRCCDPFYRKAIRVSMGHVLNVPWARFAPNDAGWTADLTRLRERDWRIVALASGGEFELRELPVTSRATALLVGSEGPGLSGAALAAADIRVRIDMRPGVDSLNVVIAAAIAMREALSPSE
ncbi:MAG: RNA methyltransferase [Planctomycetota bacterium]